MIPRRSCRSSSINMGNQCFIAFPDFHPLPFYLRTFVLWCGPLENLGTELLKIFIIAVLGKMTPTEWEWIIVSGWFLLQPVEEFTLEKWRTHFIVEQRIPHMLSTDMVHRFLSWNRCFETIGSLDGEHLVLRIDTTEMVDRLNIATGIDTDSWEIKIINKRMGSSQ